MSDTAIARAVPCWLTQNENGTFYVFARDLRVHPSVYGTGDTSDDAERSFGLAALARYESLRIAVPGALTLDEAREREYLEGYLAHD